MALIWIFYKSTIQVIFN